MSERKPTSARNGANTSGSEIITATSQAGTRELDDHHAVQRADQQHGRHADRDLEQRQPQQPAERQFRRRRVGERQHARDRSSSVPLDDGGASAVHDGVSSSACEM